MFTVYNDKVSTFEQFLHEEGSISVRIRNLKVLVIEVCKAKKIFCVLVQSIFKLINPKYNFRRHAIFSVNIFRVKNMVSTCYISKTKNMGENT